jgi:hypothetical protein
MGLSIIPACDIPGVAQELATIRCEACGGQFVTTARGARGLMRLVARLGRVHHCPVVSDEAS